jgi:hypothetical protein
VNLNNSNSLTISPNPTNQLVIVSLQSAINIANIKLFNTLGQIVMEKQNQSGNQFTLNLSTQPKGIYFVEVQEANTILRGKVVKE